MLLPALRPAVLVAAGFLLAASPIEGQGTGDLDATSFMVGCWQQSERSGLREYYAPPGENMMTGLSQFWSDGRIVDWEFHRIDAGPRGPVLTPHPRGVASVTFQPTVLERGRIVWENPDHDFPKRISYERVAPDSLVVSVDGGPRDDAGRRTWRMGRVACAGESRG